MWYVHHLSEEARASFDVVPLLPVNASFGRSENACPESVAPNLCVHARASHVCGDCHVGSVDDIENAVGDTGVRLPSGVDVDSQPDWPESLPGAITMTVTRYQNSTPPKLVDAFYVDYRYKYGQNRFYHSILNQGCTVLIENATSACNTSNVWGWVTNADGNTHCMKGFQGVAPIPQAFVAAAPDFQKGGRQTLTTPLNESIDTWTWCRRNGDECFYENVATRRWASWQFRRAGDAVDATTMEFYS